MKELIAPLALAALALVGSPACVRQPCSPPSPAGQCGHVGERACTISERTPNCDQGLTEIPGNTKFEDTADWLGWVVNTGRFVFGPPVGVKGSFRWHDAPTSRTSFVYPLCGQSLGSSLSVALFSDFGTGLYHSRYIARQLETRRFPYAVHLGDVYYAGRESEFQQQFKAPLDPLLQHTRLFTLNGNHEMFSLAVPSVAHLRRLDGARPRARPAAPLGRRSHQHRQGRCVLIRCRQGLHQQPESKIGSVVRELDAIGRARGAEAS